METFNTYVHSNLASVVQYYLDEESQSDFEYVIPFDENETGKFYFQDNPFDYDERRLYIPNKKREAIPSTDLELLELEVSPDITAVTRRKIVGSCAPPRTYTTVHGYDVNMYFKSHSYQFLSTPLPMGQLIISSASTLVLLDDVFKLDHIIEDNYVKVELYAIKTSIFNHT